MTRLSDILSQGEIDELLKALSSGDINVEEMTSDEDGPAERRIRNYDFRRPNKFAKDHIRTLTMIHENFARLIQNYLSGYLRALVQVDVISVEQLTYNEFSNSISNPVVLGIVELIPLSGSIILEIAPNIAYSLIDRILGGRGTSLERIRTFTEIELSILEKLIGQILSNLREPWETIIHLKPRLEKIETNSQFAQIISPNETVALVTLSTKIGEVEGMINLCIPHLTIEPIMHKLTTKSWFTAKEKEDTEVFRREIEERIDNVKVPLKVILGNTEFTVSDFLDLQVGDVIQLDTDLNSKLKVLVGEIHKFNAKPGVKKNRVSIKIQDVIRKEDE